MRTLLVLIMALVALNAGCTQRSEVDNKIHLDRDQWTCVRYVDKGIQNPACVVWVDMQWVLDEQKRSQQDSKL